MTTGSFACPRPERRLFKFRVRRIARDGFDHFLVRSLAEIRIIKAALIALAVGRVGRRLAFRVSPSWPGLTRPSPRTPSSPNKVLKQRGNAEPQASVVRRRVDGRDKPGHDEKPKGTPYPQLTL